MIGETIKKINELEKQSKTNNDSNCKWEFLQELGINANNIPEDFLEDNKSYYGSLEEVEKLYIERYSKPIKMKFSIKDIVGTRHPSYKDKPLILSFIELERASDIIKRYKRNPEYYRKNLKDSEFKESDSLKLFRTSDGKCFIDCGNNRLTFLRMLYKAEISKSTSETAKKQIEEKYTFYASIRSLPKNRMIAYYIIFLDTLYGKEIQIKFKGNNQDECNYEIILKGKNILVSNEDELKKLVINEFEFNDCKNMSEICKKIVLQNIYFNSKFNPLFNEIFKNYKETYENALLLRELATDNKKINLEKITIQNCSTKNIFEILKEIISSTKQKQIEYLNNIFTNCNSIDSIQNTIKILTEEEFYCKKLDIDMNEQIKNFSKFCEYFTNNKQKLPENLFASAQNYEQIYQILFNYLQIKKKEELDELTEKKEVTIKTLEEINTKKDLLNHKEDYEKAKGNDSIISKEIELKMKNIENIKNSIEEYNKKIQPNKIEIERYNKSTFFQKIFKRKKKNKAEELIAYYEKNMEELQKELEKIKEKIENLKERKKQNIKEFQKLCGKDISLEQYEILILNESEFLLEEKDKKTQKNLDTITKKIEEKSLELMKINLLIQSLNLSEENTQKKSR